MEDKLPFQIEESSKDHLLLWENHIFLQAKEINKK